MKDICFFIYTNETYLPIADLTLGEFIKFFPENPLKVYLVSNNFSDYNFTNKNENISFINTNVNLNGSGKHFSEVMRNSLNNINEEYIIFFCDDYMLIDTPNLQALHEIYEMMLIDNLDYISFSSMTQRFKWEKYHNTIDSYPSRPFYIIPNNYIYLFSVQPCIWKKSALLDILNHNLELSLHDLDTSNIRNREGHFRDMNYLTGYYSPYPNGSKSYDLKCICTDFLAYDELIHYEFLVFPYVEIIRHGFFNMSQETNTKKFLNSFLNEKNIYLNPNYKKFLI